MLPEPIDITLEVVEALDKLGIPYLIGGSLASAFYGTTRSTLDADIVADLKPEHIAHLVELLQDTFYIDDVMIESAIKTRTSFNLVHLETLFKIDVFIIKQREYDQLQLQRRVLRPLSADPEKEAFLCTAEDIILKKLEWFRMGNEVSDRQWRDILGVLKVQAGLLDMDYLNKWAQGLNLLDLLLKAIEETR